MTAISRRHHIEGHGQCETCGRFLINDYWACQRPRTGKWGSGQVFDRIETQFGRPDVAFGETDGIPPGVYSVDRDASRWKVEAGMAYRGEWTSLPFKENYFAFGYWDPPYDHLYKAEGQEIWRTVRRLAILHTFVWPIAWLVGAEREAVIAVTMGPMKQIRALQVFRKRESLERWNE